MDGVVAVTGVHRKAAIRLLRRQPRPPAGPSRAGRPRLYGPEVATAAAVLWQASGRIGAHRLHPFVPELLDRLTLFGELTLPPVVDKQLRQVSRPTLARLLGPARAHYPPRAATITAPGSWLKPQIPIRTSPRLDGQPGCPGEGDVIKLSDVRVPLQYRWRVRQRLMVLHFARLHGSTAAGRPFGVSVRTIRR